jgi:hypothetical protein
MTANSQQTYDQALSIRLQAIQSSKLTTGLILGNLNKPTIATATTR